jgi:hypothetical protein
MNRGGLVRVAGAGLGNHVLQAKADIISRAHERRHGADGVAGYRRLWREICERIWLPSGRAEETSGGENLRFLGDSGTQLGFPAKGQETIAKIFRISEQALTSRPRLGRLQAEKSFLLRNTNLETNA